MNVRHFLSIIVCLSISTLGIAQTWISIDGNKSGKCFSIDVIESTVSSYKAKIKIHGLYDMPCKEDGQEFHRLNFDIPSTISETGNPALPTINQLLALPYGDKCVVSIKEEEWTDIETGTIYPCQDPLFEERNYNVPFAINKGVYFSERFSPYLTKIGKLQKWKGMPNKNVSVCPFVYYPLENKLSVLKEFVLCVDFENTRTASPCYAKDMSLFANSNIIDGNIPDSNSPKNANDYDYLIIAGDILNITTCQALSDFCKWKAFKGLKTKVVSTTTIGSAASAIKQYIYSEKLANGIKYVLFIGDYDKIPLYVINDTALHYGLPIKSDYWYGCLDGNSDVQADIPVGRFPAANVNELSTMVEKTIRYENTPMINYDIALLVADYVIQHRTLMESIPSGNYTNMYFINLDGGSTEYNGHNNSNADVISVINNGCNIVNYFGHGIPNSWGVSSGGWNYHFEFFTDSCLTYINSDANCVFLNIACLTGDLTESQCMLRSFLKSDHGAVSFYGATNISLTDAGKTFIQSFYDKLLHHGINQLGELLLETNVVNISNMGLNAIINAFLYICGGDPSLEIWCNRSEPFESVEIEKIGNTFYFDANSISGYTVSFVSNSGELLSSSYVAGSSTYESVPTTDCYVAFSKNGYTPYVVYLNCSDNYIQNVAFSDCHKVYLNTPVYVGYDVTSSSPYGNVTVENGGKLIIFKGDGVSIENGFECKKGGIIEIK